MLARCTHCGSFSRTARPLTVSLVRADVHLKMSELDGSAVTEVDLQKLYFIYVSSKPDDWKFILEVPPAVGLGRCVRLPDRILPLYQHYAT